MKFSREKIQYIAAVTFAALTLVGNYLGIPLFFGIEFIFGSIASLLAIAIVGTTGGIFAAAIGAVYTYVAWNHPYAGIILILEAIFVAALFSRFKSNLALAAGTFWLVAGIPLVWIFYKAGLGMDNLGASLLAVKQGANGIINSILASLLITYLPLRKWLGQSTTPQLSVFQHTFNIFVGLALIPAVIIMIIDARRTVGRVEAEIQSSIETISTGLSLSASRWGSQHIRAVEQLALMGEEFGLEDRQRLQKFIEKSVEVWPDFVGVFYTDHNGTTIAFSPLKNARGESTIGLNFSDREYFKVSKSGRQQYLSKVFMARGGVFEPVVNVVSRIDRGIKFGGIISASINLNDLSAIFLDVTAGHPFVATIVEDDGTVIVSNDKSRQALTKYSVRATGNQSGMTDGFFRRWPENMNQAPMEIWKNSALGQKLNVKGVDGWSLIVEVPLAFWQVRLYERYIRDLGFVIVLSLIILFGSLWIANTIAKPLQDLSLETTNLPARLEENRSIDWPQSHLSEVNSLSENFKEMLTALKRRFQDLEASRKELDRGSRAKDDFLATLSHELRTPLNAILGHSELLSSESTLEDRKESVEAIQRNAKAQNQIIADLLDVSAIITGKITFNTEKVSLNDTISAAVGGIKNSILAKKINLKVELDPKDVILCADSTRLQQVIWNLLSNAVKFTQPLGLITVRSIVDSQGCKIQVSDSGQGISKEFLPQIFDRFTQEDSSMTRNFGGLGLGLSIVQQIVKFHEGTITVSSEGKNKGSTFTVHFPSTRFAEGDRNFIAQASKLNQLVSDSIAGVKVLIIDDDPDARALAGRFLKGTGAIVRTAGSVAQGLEAVRSFEPDVVISDIGMPGEDGFSLIAKLRSLDEGKMIPAAAITAFAGESDRNKILNAGFQAHVSKPVSKSELIKVVTLLTSK